MSLLIGLQARLEVPLSIKESSEQELIYFTILVFIQMTPRCLLVGHTAPIMCLSRASVIMEQNFIVSSSESGEMCTWDLVDGKCREAVKLNNIHTQMLPYVSAGGEDVRLFCSG